jgi:hypothetical protein
MRRTAAAASAFTVIVAFGGAGIAAQQTPAPDTDALVASATEYVKQFVAHFSNVVAEERYLQEVTYPPAPSMAPVGARGAAASMSTVPRPSLRRELKSDFLLVRNNDQSDYLIFRDVFEVDGHQIRDREQRLTKLFIESAPAALDQASRVALEGSRFNLSGERYTLNNPLVALSFLQDRYKDHFRFTLGKIDKDVGPTVWIVSFEDRLRPTLIRSDNDRDIVGRGRFWIDAETGRVLKSELIAGPARFVTLFRFDEAFRIAVPFAMQEWGQVKGGTLTGNATYSRFRTFQVSSEEKLQQ